MAGQVFSQEPWKRAVMALLVLVALGITLQSLIPHHEKPLSFYKLKWRAIDAADKGDLHTAENYFMQCYTLAKHETKKQHYTDDDRFLITFNLANIYRREAQFDKSLKFLDEAKTYTPGGSYLVENSYGSIYKDMGDLATAEDHYEKSYKLINDMQSPWYSSARSTALFNMAEIALARHQTQMAQHMMQAALNIDEKNSPSDNPILALDLIRMAHLHVTQGKDELAEVLLEQAKPSLSHHPIFTREQYGEYLITEAELARHYGNPRNAESDLKEAIIVFSQLYSPNHPKVYHVKRQLAELYLDWGRTDLAKQTINDVIKGYQQYFKPHSYYMSQAYKIKHRIEHPGFCYPHRCHHEL